MKSISAIQLNGVKQEKQEAREILAKAHYNLNGQIPLSISLSAIDRKVKHGFDLSFDEAFAGMNYVLAATNNRFREKFYDFLPAGKAQVLGTSFLQLMAVKESLKYLTPEEVAGMSAASFADLVIRLPFSDVVFEGCGMGGDKGFSTEETIKTINASTLSSLVLASLGIPVIKHGSYCNTSALGSTEAIELFGAKTSFTSTEEVENLFTQTNFFYADAHLVKTIHDLSHLLMMETINHIVGPMTPPIAAETTIHRLMGVNEKVHPITIAKAYEILNQKGFQKIGNAAIVCGLSREADGIDIKNHQQVKKYVILDELSPYQSVVAVLQNGKYVDTFSLYPEDFGISIKAEKIQVPGNQEQIHQANLKALKGEDSDLADYLAMNAALGLFVFQHLSQKDAITPYGWGFRYALNSFHLQSCFKECRQAIEKGDAYRLLQKYVELSNQ